MRGRDVKESGAAIFGRARLLISEENRSEKRRIVAVLVCKTRQTAEPWVARATGSAAYSCFVPRVLHTIFLCEPL
jgi:hypothetical protein